MIGRVRGPCVAETASWVNFLAGRAGWRHQMPRKRLWVLSANPVSRPSSHADKFASKMRPAHPRRVDAGTPHIPSPRSGRIHGHPWNPRNLPSLRCGEFSRAGNVAESCIRGRTGAPRLLANVSFSTAPKVTNAHCSSAFSSHGRLGPSCDLYEIEHKVIRILHFPVQPQARSSGSLKVLAMR